MNRTFFFCDKVDLPNFVLPLINKIAEKEKFTSYELKTTVISCSGENYLGLLYAVKLSGERVACTAASERIRGEVHLICKLPPLSGICLTKFNVLFHFEREIFMYEHVLPKFVEFQCARGLSAEDSFLSFAKVYAKLADGERNQYALIMEDLRSREFALWPRSEQISLANEMKIMQELAKLHAVSFAMKDQQPDAFAALKIRDSYYPMIEAGGMKRWIEDALSTIEQCIEPKYSRLLTYFSENFGSIFKKALYDIDAYQKLGVVGHGDLWMNNILFRFGPKVSIRPIGSRLETN